MLNRVLLMHMNTWRETVMKPFFNDAQWWNLRQWTQTYTGDCLSTRKYFFSWEDGQALAKVTQEIVEILKICLDTVLCNRGCWTRGALGIPSNLTHPVIQWFTSQIWYGKKNEGKKILLLNNVFLFHFNL